MTARRDSPSRRVVTVAVPTMSTPFSVDSVDSIARAAQGDHEPFSTIATRRLRHPFAARRLRNAAIGGNTPPSYEAAARTMSRQRKASATAKLTSVFVRSTIRAR